MKWMPVLLIGGAYYLWTRRDAAVDSGELENGFLLIDGAYLDIVRADGREYTDFPFLLIEDEDGSRYLVGADDVGADGQAIELHELILAVETSDPDVVLSQMTVVGVPNTVSTVAGGLGKLRQAFGNAVDSVELA